MSGVLFSPCISLRLCWLEDSLSLESSQHSRSQTRIKEEGCVRFWQTSIKIATLMDYSCVYIMHTQQKRRSRTYILRISFAPFTWAFTPTFPTANRNTKTFNNLMQMEGGTQEQKVFFTIKNIPLRSGSISWCSWGLTMFGRILPSKHVQAT